MNQQTALLPIIVSMSLLVHAHAQVTVTPVFDESSNPVEKVAAFGSKKTMPTVEDWKSAVADAAAEGRGGVITFEDLGDSVHPKEIKAVRPDGSTLVIRNEGFDENAGPHGDFSLGTQAGDRRAVSGTAYLSKQGPPGYFFNFQPEDPAERITQLGFALLARKARTYHIGARVKFEDAKPKRFGCLIINGVVRLGPNAEILQGPPEGDVGTGDLLLWFEAPPGDRITHVEIFGHSPCEEGAWYSGIDNISFITEKP